MQESINISDEELQYLVFCNIVKLAHLDVINLKMQSLLLKLKTAEEFKKTRKS
jgi:hypothetical protein